MPEPGDRKISREVLSGTTARVVLLVIGFLGNIVFARVLGASGFGAFYLLVTVENIIDQPLLGWAQSAKKRLSETDSPESEIRGAFFVITGLAMILLIGAIVLLRDVVNGYVDLASGWIILIVLLLTLGWNETLTKLLSATGRVGLVSWIDALRSLLTIPLQVGLVVVGFGVVGMTAGLGGATVIAIGLILWYLDLETSVPSRETLRSMWEYARYSVPSTFVSLGYDRFAFVLTGAVFGTEIAGYFEVSVKLTLPAVVVAGIASGVLFPKISDLRSRGDAVREDIENVLSFSSVIAIPMTFGAVALAHRVIITIYSSEYAQAGSLLVFFAGYRLMRTRSKPLVSALRGLDRPDIDLRSNVTALAVLGTVGIPGSLFVGVRVLIVAMILASLTRYLIASRWVQREIGEINHFTRPFVHQTISGVVMYGFLEIAKTQVEFAPWWKVFIVVAVGAGVYFGCLLTLSSETRHTLQDVAGLA